MGLPMGTAEGALGPLVGEPGTFGPLCVDIVAWTVYIISVSEARRRGRTP
jgi:hypothetical protein